MICFSIPCGLDLLEISFSIICPVSLPPCVSFVKSNHCFWFLHIVMGTRRLTFLGHSSWEPATSQCLLSDHYTNVITIVAELQAKVEFLSGLEKVKRFCDALKRNTRNHFFMVATQLCTHFHAHVASPWCMLPVP